MFPEQATMEPEGVGRIIEAAEHSLSAAGVMGKPLVRLPSRKRTVFLGDTEGKTGLTKEVLGRYIEDADTTIVFLGDYIDRGPYQFENAFELILGAMKAPGRVVLLRGNHETEDCSPHDFPERMRQKFGSVQGGSLYDRIMRFFAMLPLAAVVEGYFCAHGGIPDPVLTLTELEGLKMGMVSMVRDLHVDDGPEIQLVWNDPAPRNVLRNLNERGFLPNDRRGIGKYYGPQAVTDFLSKNGLKGIIRGHGGADSAIRTDFGARVITINETGPDSSLNPWVQGILHLEGGRLRAEIFSSRDDPYPEPTANEFAANAEKVVNEELVRSVAPPNGVHR